MGVDVGGHLDVRVSQPFLHILEGEAHVNEQAGAGVPQLVEAEVGENARYLAVDVYESEPYNGTITDRSE